MPRNAVYQTVERFLRDKLGGSAPKSGDNLGGSAPKSVAISLSGGVDSMVGWSRLKCVLKAVLNAPGFCA